MKRNILLILASSFSLVFGIAILSQYSGIGSNTETKALYEENEEGEEKGAAGAMELLKAIRYNEVTGTLEPEWITNAVNQADALKVSSRAMTPIVWQSMGPDNFGGRVRAFLMHRDSGNLMFVGSVSGGLFRSNTNGQSWKPVNDMQQNLGVSCIAQTTDGIIYYGTGEVGFTNSGGNKASGPGFTGIGIFKSTDPSGTVYTNIANTKGWTFVNDIVAHPALESTFWVASSSGVKKTTNGGTSWINASSAVVADLAIDKDGIVWFAGYNGSVFKSNADGTSFTQVKSTAGMGRTSIAISPQDPQFVYVMSALSGGVNNNKLGGVWRSTNAGASWDLIVNYSTVTNVFGLNAQGWYDNVIGVDPLNKNRVYLGGVTLASWDSDDGFREIAGTPSSDPWNSSILHPDQHVIQWDMRTSPPTMIVGNDGGLYFTQNQFTWTRRNRGFVSLQAYSVAANTLGHVLGGSQDNGTHLINFTGNSFDGEPSKNSIEVSGGDGFDAEFSAYNPKTLFTSIYNGDVFRSGNAGQSVSTFWDARQDGAVVTDFSTCFTLWEKSALESKLFLAKDAEVWTAINPTDFAIPPVWYLLSAGLGADRIMDMDHTPDGDHLFIAKYSDLYRVDSITTAVYNPSSGAKVIPPGIKTTSITPAAANGRVITSVNVDMANANHVVVTLGGYGNSIFVLETNNALDAVPVWTNITGNLPSMPVYDALVDVDDPNRIILGTELGVWLTENGGTSWEEANTGMARVPVWEIRGYEYHPWEGMAVYIGTHGRGFFKSASLLTSTKKLDRDATTIKVYPNPAKENMQISFTSKGSGTAVLEIFSINGTRLQSKNLNVGLGNNSTNLDVSSLSNGYYFARVIQGTNSSTVKFTVQH